VFTAVVTAATFPKFCASFRARGLAIVALTCLVRHFELKEACVQLCFEEPELQWKEEALGQSLVFALPRICSDSESLGVYRGS
jgi:hypothetical protein